MKVSDDVIETLTGEKCREVRLLEMCNAELLFIENIQKCVELRILNLRGNFIKEIENIYTLKNLWNLDLAHNELTSVTGLSRFVALGNLNLSFNSLTWKALFDIKHLHICNLHLQGNIELQKDKNYRTHVIDSLPNVWVLDGKFVSAIERLQVVNFFYQSEMSKHPIRSKLPKQERFKPTYKKDLLSYGVFGEKVDELFMNFPTRDTSLVINSEMDRKKLHYLAYNLQEEIEIEKSYAFDVMDCEFPEKFMEDLLNVRSIETERSNMLLILILASLDFTLPFPVMQEMLETAQLDFLGGVNTVRLFEYPRRIRTEMAIILIGSAMVDQNEKRDGGLYPLLNNALEKTLENVVKTANCDRVQYVKRKYKQGLEYLRVRPVLAAEVVQLLCVSPTFYDVADSDPALRHLLSLALGDEVAMEKVMGLLLRLKSEEVEKEEQAAIMEDTAKFIIATVQQNTSQILEGKTTASRKPPSGKTGFERPKTGPSYQNLNYRPRSGYKQKEYSSTLTWLHEQLSPRKPPRASSATSVQTQTLRCDPIKSGIVGTKAPRVQRPMSSVGNYNDNGQKSNRTSGSAIYRPTSGKMPHLPPRIGDVVLLGPQNSGHILAIPDRNIAMVVISETTGQNGGIVSRFLEDEERYVYVRLDELQYDNTFDWWKPKNYIGDRVTLMDSRKFLNQNLDPAQVAFETRYQFSARSGEPGQLPRSMTSSALNTFAHSNFSSPDPSPDKSPVEWQQSILRGSKIVDNDADGDSDSTKGMSRASSPAEKDNEEEDQNEKELKSVAAELAVEAIQSAVKDLQEKEEDYIEEEEEDKNVELTESNNKNNDAMSDDGEEIAGQNEAELNGGVDNNHGAKEFEGGRENEEAKEKRLEPANVSNWGTFNGTSSLHVDMNEISIGDHARAFESPDQFKHPQYADKSDTNRTRLSTFRELRCHPTKRSWAKRVDNESAFASTSIKTMNPSAREETTAVHKALTPRRAKSASTSGRISRSKQTSPSLKSGNSWLAAGKNVYKPVEMTESFLIPGWVQSMEPRAKKAYLRRMVNKYTESASSKSETSSAHATHPRVSIRAMSAQMKNVCNNCTATSRKQLMERYYSPNMLPRISDPETHWQHYV